jgi:predicted dehydrogenase
MGSPVRVGFVGVGGIAGHHLKQLQSIEDARVVALCDVVEERVRQRVEEFGGTAYTDYRQMIEREEMDALYVCIPPFTHQDAEILAAQKGIHLFVEKPVALTMEKALEVQEAVQRAGVITSVGYTLRYFAVTDVARRYLQDKTIAMVTSHRWGGLPDTPWWRVMGQSGGQLVEQTTHQVDLMRYLAGEIVEVHARYATRVLGDVPNLDIPDVQVATFQFESGAVGSLTTSCALRKGGGKSDLNFILRDALLQYTTRDVKVSPDSAPQPEPAVGEHLTIDQAFIRAVATGDRSLIRSPYEDGLRSMDVTLAANESARTGKPVATHYAKR